MAFRSHILTLTALFIRPSYLDSSSCCENEAGIYIYGSLVRPAEVSEEFKKWNRIHSMLTTWILNSISKDIVEAFMYVSSTRDLWMELEARYGESNGPSIYQLQRLIRFIVQGNKSMTNYYTKLKKLWDKLACLAPTPGCACVGFYRL